MKFAICNETYQRWEFARACEHAAGCGYDGLEIAPFTLAADPHDISESRAQEVGGIARGAGIDVIGLHWLLRMPEGLHLTTPDDGVRKRTVDFVKHLVRVCAAMATGSGKGGGVMVLGSPKQRNVGDGVEYEDAFKRAADACRQVCEVAQPLGVILALEPLSHVETNFLKTASEAVTLIKEVAHPSCRLHLDVKAMCSEGKPVPEIIAENRDTLAHFHANDPNLRGPGFGDVDFVPIAAALKEAKYDDYVSVEVFDYSPDPETIARESLAYLKKTFAEAGAI